MDNFNFSGCLPEKIDLRDYKVCSSNLHVDYPNEFVLTNLPRIKSQGGVSSCCAHATSSILEYFANNEVQLSTNFIYGIDRKLNDKRSRGMYIVQACKIVSKYGDMTESDCPGNTEVPICCDAAEKSAKDSNKKTNAYKYRILSYYKCITDNDIKYALMNYGPILGAIRWYSKYTLDKDGIITFDKSTSHGGHAVMIYGWNQKGWLVQNSWGVTFGRGGRFILPFSDGFTEARALIDYEEDDEALIKPKNNPVMNVIYRGLNGLINLIEQSQYK